MPDVRIAAQRSCPRNFPRSLPPAAAVKLHRAIAAAVIIVAAAAAIAIEFTIYDIRFTRQAGFFERT
jgi:hypothetical protein